MCNSPRTQDLVIISNFVLGISMPGDSINECVETLGDINGDSIIDVSEAYFLH